jgi:hypothetical protein
MNVKLWITIVSGAPGVTARPPLWPAQLPAPPPQPSTATSIVSTTAVNATGSWRWASIIGLLYRQHVRLERIADADERVRDRILA